MKTPFSVPMTRKEASAIRYALFYYGALLRECGRPENALLVEARTAAERINDWIYDEIGRQAGVEVEKRRQGLRQ